MFCCGFPEKPAEKGKPGSGKTKINRVCPLLHLHCDVVILRAGEVGEGNEKDTKMNAGGPFVYFDNYSGVLRVGG